DARLLGEVDHRERRLATDELGHAVRDGGAERGVRWGGVAEAISGVCGARHTHRLTSRRRGWSGRRPAGPPGEDGAGVDGRLLPGGAAGGGAGAVGEGGGGRVERGAGREVDPYGTVQGEAGVGDGGEQSGGPGVPGVRLPAGEDLAELGPGGGEELLRGRDRDAGEGERGGGGDRQVRVGLGEVEADADDGGRAVRRRGHLGEDAAELAGG